jgi:uncharacterized protein YbjT (DUF2867 family)
MKKVLLVGGTGQLGKKIAAELIQQGYAVTALVRNEEKKSVLGNIISEFIVADITQSGQLTGICKGIDIVVSSLGKSVSIHDKSKPTFRQIDFEANSTILNEAVKECVQKFVYVSAFGAENYLHLDYFKVHHDFSEELKASGINYTIVKPPAIFSSFLDLVDMAKKGRLMTMGKGDKVTNPIDASDLAKICIEGINRDNTITEAGGKTVYSRQQINEIIQQEIRPTGKVRRVPVGPIRLLSPMLKIINRNLYDKIAFFLEVTQHDTLAPKIGTTTLEEWVKRNT